MTRQVVFRVIARNEYDAAVDRYERARAGLGFEFQATIDQTLAVIAQQPTLFRLVHGPVRRAVLKRFPYSIHFIEESRRIVVLAIFHAARDPKELPPRG